MRITSTADTLRSESCQILLQKIGMSPGGTTERQAFAAVAQLAIFGFVAAEGRISW
jgi:hypothetical protein